MLNSSIVKCPLSFYNKTEVAITNSSLFNNISENSKLFTFPYTNRFEIVPKMPVLIWPHASVQLLPSTAVLWVYSYLNNGALWRRPQGN